MKRLIPLVVLLVGVPAFSVSATTLDDLLERSGDAAYSAEQMISCTTPDGFRAVLAKIKQNGPSISIASAVATGEEIAIAPGVWARLAEGGIVQETSVGGEVREVVDIYEVEDLGERAFMGRQAEAFRLSRDQMLRGELVLDTETGALVRATTFASDGSPYCVRSFVSFDPAIPTMHPWESQVGSEQTMQPDALSGLPEVVAGFTLLDSYLDLNGMRLTYYSDGFFSFAIFQTPNRIELSDSLLIDFDGFQYRREFTPGQVTYAWEVRDQGMALVGDLPPDLHREVLEAMPKPVDMGFLQRIWRNLFGPR